MNKVISLADKRLDHNQSSEEKAELTEDGVAAKCAIGNLSDVARKSNRYLATKNLFISCRRPASRLANRFSEPSRMFQWGIYRTDEQTSDGEN